MELILPEVEVAYPIETRNCDFSSLKFGRSMIVEHPLPANGQPTSHVTSK